MKRAVLQKHLLPFALFFLLACLMAWWPLFHVGTHIPNTEISDYFHFNWNYWWARHALTTPGLNLYETNFVLFPFTTNLGYHTLLLFWFPLWAVLEPLVGTLWAMEAIMLLAIALTGYCCFLLLRREGVSPGLALVGAAIYQLTPAMFSAILFYTPNYMNFFWPPLQLLIWGQVARWADKGWRGILWALIQGVAFYAMFMTDSQFFLYTALLIVPYGLLTLVEAKTTPARLRLCLLGGLALGIMLTLVWFVGPLRYMLAFDRAALAPPPAEEAYSIPFPQGYITHDGDYGIITLGAVFMPLLLLTLLASFTTLRRKIRDRGRWFWLLVALPPLILSVGAFITIGGTTIPMPYQWLHEALGGMLRSSHRFGAIFLIPAAIFIGRTWTPTLRQHCPARIFAPAILLLIIIWDARLFWPMPLQPVVPSYDFYAMIGGETGAAYDDLVVLEVPVAAGSGEIWVGQFNHLKTQFYGMTHGKRMVNGLISRSPIEHFWYLRTDDPLLSWLGQRRFIEPELAAPELRQIVAEWPVGYVVVHQDLIGREGPTVQEVIGWLNDQPDALCPLLVERDAVLYRTSAHPDGCPPRTPPEIEPDTYQIDFGSAGDERFIGWGWHWQEAVSGLTLRWTGEYPQTELYADLPPGDYEVTISAQAFWEERNLDLLVNGQPAEPLGSTSVPVEGLISLSYRVPVDLIGDSEHITFTLAYDATVIPAEVGQSADPRKLAIAVDWIRFTRS